MCPRNRVANVNRIVKGHEDSCAPVLGNNRLKLEYDKEKLWEVFWKKRTNHFYFQLSIIHCQNSKVAHPMILATQEAEVRRKVVRSHPWANGLWDPILKNPITKMVWCSRLNIKSACLASLRPWVQTPLLQKKPKKQKQQPPLPNKKPSR
jgi:hypothetical protein